MRPQACGIGPSRRVPAWSRCPGRHVSAFNAVARFEHDHHPVPSVRPSVWPVKLHVAKGDGKTSMSYPIRFVEVTKTAGAPLGVLLEKRSNRLEVEKVDAGSPCEGLLKYDENILSINGHRVNIKGKKSLRAALDLIKAASSLKLEVGPPFQKKKRRGILYWLWRLFFRRKGKVGVAAMDADGDGKITREEMIAGMAGDVDAGTASQIFNMVRVSHCQKIPWPLWVA